MTAPPIRLPCSGVAAGISRSPVAFLAITASALERVRGFRAAAPDPSDRVLSVRVTGETEGEYLYARSLEPLANIRAGDSVQHQGVSPSW